MANKPGSVPGEPERKRQRHLPPSSSQSSSEASGVSSTSRAVSSTSPSSASSSPNVASSGASVQAKIKTTSTPTDRHNLRGIRSKADLEMLQGEHFTVEVVSVEPKRKWVLPRKLLTSHSPYFARMSSEKTKHLLYVYKVDSFELFAQWLYLGELNFDDVNVSSETLITAWVLGNELRCPAFRDHLMVQLIKSHYERGIKPQTLRDALVFPFPNPKLGKWAIDQFHAKITYGYTGYDDQEEDDPSDWDTLKKYAKDMKAFGQGFLEACLDAGQGADPVKKPWENGQQYMEVSRYAEIGVCKEEDRSLEA